MEFWKIILTFALVSGHFVTPLPIPDDEEVTIIPILRPPPSDQDQYVPEGDSDGQPEQDVQPQGGYTDFPILMPGGSDNDGVYEEYGIDRPRPIDSESDAETDDSPVPRPHPGQSDEYVEAEQGEIIDPRLFRLKRSAHHEEGHVYEDGTEEEWSDDEEESGEEYGEYIVQRPIPEGEYSEEDAEEDDGYTFYEPEGNEMQVEDEVEILYPEAGARKKRSTDDEKTDEEADDDDYVIPRPIADWDSEEEDVWDYNEGDDIYDDTEDNEDDDTEILYPEEVNKKKRSIDDSDEESDEEEDNESWGDYEYGDSFYEPEDEEDEDDTVILYPEERKKRDAEPDNYDEEYVPSVSGGEDDDTVIVEAASCAELQKKCKETGDLFACSAHKENCGNENGIEDTQINDIINCAYAGKNGKHNGRCPTLASD